MNRYRRKTQIEAAQAWGRNAFAGWLDYRNPYGKPQKTVTLANVSILEKREVMNPDRKRVIVSKTADFLNPTRYSLWEKEGVTKAGLRTALIFSGHSFEDSDFEATDIVRRAFNLLGRGKDKRPTCDEATEEYYIPRENCLVCYSPLDDEQIARHTRYCCVEHARFALERRVYAEKWWRSEYGKAAYRIIFRDRNEELKCENPRCRSPMFKPIDPNSGQRFCSKACAYEAMELDFPERQCALFSCEEVFKPTARNPGQKYCCHTHALEAKRTLMDRCCARAGCGKAFRPKHNNEKEGGSRGLYCSRECARLAQSAAVHQLRCECCGDDFTASVPHAKYCSDAHRQIVLNIKKGKPPKRLNAGVFDYLFVARAA